MAFCEGHQGESAPLAALIQGDKKRADFKASIMVLPLSLNSKWTRIRLSIWSLPSIRKGDFLEILGQTIRYVGDNEYHDIVRADPAPFRCFGAGLRSCASAILG